MSGLQTPCVSIGLPLFNAEASLTRCLDSILGQDFADFEVVIADNASLDATGDICRQYEKRDRRVRYFRNDVNIGVNPNHDRVFELSRGKYFAWSAADVEWRPGMLRRCVEVLASAPKDVVLVYPWCEMVSDGQTVSIPHQQSIECRDPRPYRRMEAVTRHVVMVTQLYGLMKRDALSQTRLNGAYASSDVVLLVELAMIGQIWELPEALLQRKVDSHRGTAAVCHNPDAWFEWLAPGRKRKLEDRLGHNARLALEYWRGAWRMPLTPVDKLVCLTIAPWLAYWRTILRITGPARHAWRRVLGRRKNIRHSALSAE